MYPVKIFIVGLVSLVQGYGASKDHVWLVAPNGFPAHEDVFAWQIDADAAAKSFERVPLKGVLLRIAGLAAGSPSGLPAPGVGLQCHQLGSPFPADLADSARLDWLFRPACLDPKLRSFDKTLLATLDPNRVAWRLDLKGVGVKLSTASVASIGNQVVAATFANGGIPRKILGMQALADVMVVESESAGVVVEAYSLDGKQMLWKKQVPVVDGEIKLLLGNVSITAPCADVGFECLEVTEHHMQMFLDMAADKTSKLFLGGFSVAPASGIDPDLRGDLVRLQEGPADTGSVHRPICMLSYFEVN